MSNSTPALQIARAAKAAFEASQLIVSSERINALNAIKDQLNANKEEILAANRQDLEVSPCIRHSNAVSHNDTGRTSRSNSRTNVRVPV